MIQDIEWFTTYFNAKESIKKLNTFEINFFISLLLQNTINDLELAIILIYYCNIYKYIEIYLD